MTRVRCEQAIPLFEQLFVPALGPLNGPLEQAPAVGCRHSQGHA